MEESNEKHEGMEATKVPVFLKNFITIAKGAIDLQQNHTNYRSPRDIVTYLMGNANKIIDFELEWVQYEIENSTEEYPEIKAEIIQRKVEFSDALLQFKSRVDPSDPNIDHLCEEFLDTWGPLCSTACLSHEETAIGYVARLEITVGFASRSLEICNEAVMTRDNNEIVDKFQLATVIIAKLAESCSLMSIQQSTAADVAEILQSHFNNLSQLNEELADRINLYFGQKNSKQKDEAHTAILLTIENLGDIANDIATRMAEEREKLETQDLFMIYTKATAEQRECIRIAREAFEAEVNYIKEHGALQKIRRIQEEKGIQPTKAMMELAKMNDDLEIALEAIQHQLVSGGKSADIVTAVNAAAPKILSMPVAAKTYLKERAAQLSEMATSIKSNLKEGGGQLDEITTQLEKIEQSQTKEEALAVFEESRSKTQEILNQFLSSFENDDPQMLGHERFEAVKEETTELHKEIRQLDDELDGVQRGRRLTNMVTRAKLKLKTAEEGVSLTATENQKNFKEINDKIDRSITNAHNHLIRATNRLIEDGSHGTAEITAVCEELSALVEFSSLFLPATPEVEEVEEAEEAEEEQNPLGDMLISLTSGGQKYEAKNAAQLRMERLEKRQSKRLSGSHVRGLSKRVSERILSKQVTPKEALKASNEDLSYVKNQVQEIEFSLQIFEEKLKKKNLRSVPKKLQPKPSEFVDIKEEDSEDPAHPEHHTAPKKHSIWDEKGTVQLEETGEKESVRCGNIDQLIIHLTSSGSDSLTSANFFQTFMVTLQTFLKPEEFLDKMIDRFRVPPCPDGEDPQKYQEELVMPIQVRTCSVLKKWISMRFDQDFAANPLLIENLRNFLENDVTAQNPFLAKNILNFLDFNISGEASKEHELVAQLTGGKFEWEIPLEKRMIPDQIDPFPGFPSLLHFDGKLVAQQMTLIDAELFRAIRLHELAGQAWNSKEKEKRSPNLLRFIMNTNRVSLWVANSILKERDAKARAKVMSNFIVLCSYLKAMRNFNGVMGILAGLSTAAVSRLKHTKKLLPSKIVKLSEELEQVMSSLSSFKNYRDMLKNSPPPYIPFVGILLSDLTFAEDGNPDFSAPGQVNWLKRTLLFGLLSELTNQQRICHFKEFTQNHVRKGLLNRLAQQQIGAEELYELSLKLEPRDAVKLRRSEKVQSLNIMTLGFDVLRKFSEK